MPCTFASEYSATADHNSDLSVNTFPIIQLLLELVMILCQSYCIRDFCITMIRLLSLVRCVECLYPHVPKNSLLCKHQH